MDNVTIEVRGVRESNELRKGLKIEGTPIGI